VPRFKAHAWGTAEAKAEPAAKDCPAATPTCMQLVDAVDARTSRANVAALLSAQLGRDWADRFGAIVCGEDVERKKPDPAVYVEALRLLNIEARSTSRDKLVTMA
jgi:beta-phosphoglucomutase-like phosphatase (HAD superfamily)